MQDNTLAQGSIDVTEEYRFNEEHGIANDPVEFMKRLKEAHAPQNEVPNELNGAVIAFKVTSSTYEVNGDLVANVKQEDIRNIQHVYNNYMRAKERLEKLFYKRQTIQARAGKLLQQILGSRNEKLVPGKTALGISRDNGILYIGNAGKVHADPEAAPNVLQGDKVIGKLTKVEERKIQEINVEINLVEDRLKNEQSSERESRMELMRTYFNLFGSEYMKKLMNSGQRFENIEFVANTQTCNVRCCVKK